MKYRLESDFSKHVKGEEQHPVYLLYGEQVYLICLYEKMLMKKALGGAPETFNLHRFEGADFDLQQFYDAVESVPMFGGSRCVTLDAEPDKLSAGELGELCGVIADLPASTTVIITIKNAPAKKEKLNTLIKACDKAGCVVELATRRTADTLRFLRDRAQKNGCELSSDNASYMLERCADDMQQLSIELDKLCAYVGSGSIAREDIDSVVTTVMQARVYDLSKAILKGDFTRSMELLDRLLYLREPAARVLAVLAGAFVDLYRGFAARQAGISAVQAAIDLGYAKNREFVIKNAMTDSGGYTAPQLGRMLDLLVQADVRLKSTGTEERVVLEQTITKLFMLTGK